MRVTKEGYSTHRISAIQLYFLLAALSSKLGENLAKVVFSLGSSNEIIILRIFGS
jgi:hypothetical protein